MKLYRIEGFDWDSGNLSKCTKRVPQQEIEKALLNPVAIEDDPHSKEQRKRAIGKTPAGRYVFIVFTLRGIWKKKLRPISARYMHQKEVDHYEKST